MGPQDVPYYRHDRAYQKAIDAGKNPYFTFQPSDQRLMDDLSGSWNPVDLVARGAFGLKKLFSDTPDPKPTFKRVDSVPDPVPVESNVHYTDVVFPSSMGTNPSKKKKKGKKNIAPVIPENSSSRARPPGSGIYGPGGTQSRGAGARRVRTNIKYKKRDFYD